jgi:hypothetical protein
MASKSTGSTMMAITNRAIVGGPHPASSLSTGDLDLLLSCTQQDNWNYDDCAIRPKSDEMQNVRRPQNHERQSNRADNCHQKN